MRQALASGAIAGYPMQDIRVVVYDGKHHPVDSKEVAFIAAGKKAFLDAVGKARPQVLEPIADLEVSAPEQHMGDISGGLSSKRARINGTDTLRGGEIVVKAQVPMSELEGYAAELKSVTAGAVATPGLQPLRTGAGAGPAAAGGGPETAPRRGPRWRAVRPRRRGPARLRAADGRLDPQCGAAAGHARPEVAAAFPGGGDLLRPLSVALALGLLASYLGLWRWRRWGSGWRWRCRS